MGIPNQSEKEPTVNGNVNTNNNNNKNVAVLVGVVILVIVCVGLYSHFYSTPSQKTVETSSSGIFDSPSNEICGRWQDERDIVTFKSNGTYNASYYWLSGDYTIEGDKLTMSYVLAGAQTYYIDCFNDELTLYKDIDKTDKLTTFTKK